MSIHSYLSPKCEIQTSTLHGTGLFAKEALASGELVAVFGGELIHVEGIASLEVASSLLQIAEEVYLGSPIGDRLNYPYTINHSCDPNIGVQGQSIFLARRPIQVGEELTYDYETTDMAYPGWHIPCQCGSQNCRGVIDGNAWKNPEFQQGHEGWFSWYLQEKIRLLRSGLLPAGKE